MQIARNPAQASRLAAEIDEELSWKVDGIAAADEIRSGRTDSVRRRGVGLPHAALRADPTRPAGARFGRYRRAARRRHLRELTRHRDRGGSRGHAAGHRQRADRAASDRGLHRADAGAATALAADEQLDDRHRPDSRERLGVDRLGGPRNRRRHRARLLLRPAHRRRPHRDRRAQRAVPLCLPHRRRRPGTRAHHQAPDRDAALDPPAGP